MSQQAMRSCDCTRSNGRRADGGPLRGEQTRADRKTLAVPTAGTRFEPPPRRERSAPEAPRDDPPGPRVEDLRGGDGGGELFWGGKNVVPAAKAQRVADE